MQRVAMDSSGFNLGTTGADELIARRPDTEPPEFDITAMVDLVFMMNIYFLVTFVGAMGALNLPAARHVSALDGDSAVILTLKRSLDGKSVTLYIGEGDKGEAINDAVQQEQRIQAAMEQGIADGKKAVLLKAEKKVRAADTDRIARAATSVATEGGVKLYIGVMEKEK
jgi:biopolymer transport protein ExbD